MPVHLQRGSRSTYWGGKVFRLQGIPASYSEKHEVAKLLSQSLEGLSASNIEVRSIARRLERRGATTASQQVVATVMFRREPPLDDLQSRDEWTLSPPWGGELTLDLHFLDFTPLTDFYDTNNPAVV